MKKKIKLKDLTKEQWDNFNKNNCVRSIEWLECRNCIFNHVNCSYSDSEDSWINNKDLYSDKLLNQEVEIEIPDILDEKEKEYLSSVIKPFRDRVNYIKKNKLHDKYFIVINIYSDFTIEKTDYIDLPFFKNDMYQGMELDKEYTLADLGLFQENTKITLTEFWNSKKKLAIHCDTEEKAIKLLKVFDKMGKKWSAGKSYLGSNYWGGYEENTCYSNTHGYCYINWFKKNGYKIYEFKDVDFEDLEK